MPTPKAPLCVSEEKPPNGGMLSVTPYGGLRGGDVAVASVRDLDYSLLSRSSTMWPTVAAEFSLTVDEVRDRAASLMDLVPGAFAAAADDDDVRALGSDLPGRLTELVTRRVHAVPAVALTTGDRRASPALTRCRG